MKRRSVWTRMTAALLAALMLISSDSVVSLGQTVATDETLPESTEESASDLETYKEREINEPDRETDTEAQSDVADTVTGQEPQDTTEDTSAVEQASLENTRKDQEKPETAAPDKEVKTAESEKLRLADQKTNVRVVDENGALLADTKMEVKELKENEFADASEKAVADALETENLQIDKMAFYDIDLGGADVNGRVEVWIPLPDTYDGEIDAWYVDDEEPGKVENLDGEKKADGGDTFYVFQTDHFSVYGVTSSVERQDEEKDEMSANDLDLDEELTVSIAASSPTAAYGTEIVLTGTVSDASASLQWQRMGSDGKWENIAGANTAEYRFTFNEENASYQYRLEAVRGTEEPVYSDALSVTRQFSSLQELIEAYYGSEDGSAPASDPQEAASVNVTRSDGSDTEVLAGDTISLRVEYYFSPAPTYNYGNSPESIYDTYDDSVIMITLPEGMSISEDDNVSIPGISHFDKPENPEEDNTYTFYLSAASLPAGSGTTGSFLLNVGVDGNGSLPAGSQFDFAEDMASITTKFVIKDKSGSTAEEVRTVSQTNTSGNAPDTLTAKTNDSWVIDKAFEGAVPYEEDGEEKVKVTFSLAVGLDDGTGTASSTPENYAVHGRAPFKDDSVTLTETPSVKDRDGDPITAESITVIPDFDTDNLIAVDPAGSTAALPLDTCEGKDLTGVADSAPYYSTYTVEIVYPYEKFVAEYYDENQDPLTVENTAVFNYQIAGMDPEKDDAGARGDVGEVTEPAAIRISKYIDGSLTGSPALYASGTDWDPVEGAAEFTVTDSEGKPAVLYYLDGSTYKKLEMNGESLSSVQIDPEGDSQPYVGTDGTVTVYLDPGTYTVTETKAPDNTIIAAEDAKEIKVAGGETENAVFTNEEQLGSITVHKIGIINGSETDLQGAEFGVYSDPSCEDGFLIGKTQTTDGSGSLVFDRLEISETGTDYYVKELNAPSGYVYEPEVQTVRLTIDDSDQELTFTNTYNGAYISLEKMIHNFTTGGYEIVSRSRYADPADFNGAFTIQRKTGTEDGTSVWTDVEGYTSVSLGENGCYTPATPLPVYDENGALIEYRVREVLPEGLHAGQGMTEAEEGTGDDTIPVAYKEFTLESEEGNSASEPYVITLNNDRNGSFTLTKSFYAASASGMAPVTGETAEFTLYRKSGDGKIEAVGTYEISASDPQITVHDLEREDDAGMPYQYYWAESERTDDYKPSDTAGGTRSVEAVEITVNGETVTAYGPYDFTEKINGNIELSQSITVSNIEQKVPAVVYKIDTLLNSFVSGSKFTVYKLVDGEEQAIEGLTDVKIKDRSGAFIKLDPGYKYVIEETDSLDGYTCVNTGEELTIDLTDITDVAAGTDVHEVTIKNEPDPLLSVVKKLDDADGTDKTLTGVEFEVYTKNEDGTFTRVRGYDGKDLSVVSGSSVRLPEGTYYLREIAPDTVLGPEDYYELYEEAGANVEKSSDLRDTNVYFGPFAVDKTQSVTPITAAITNYASDGAVTVTKQGMKTDGTSAPLSGATLKIYRKDSEGNVIEAGEGGAAYTVVTDSQGEATFSGLPVYDPETKEKYTYYVKETEAPAGYSVNEGELSFQLEAGTTVAGGDLTIIDQPVLDFIVTKEYYNAWESNFTHKNYLLPGTVIALYRLEGEAYVLEDVKTTGDDGTVTFEDLNQADSYVAIEVRVPEGDEYAYLEPENGDYLDPDYSGDIEDLPASIAADKIGQYNYAEKSANTDVPDPEVEETLTNVENWTQLRIRKFKWDEDAEHTEENKIDVNNAEFTLYQQILPEGTDTDAVLSPTLDEIEQMTVIGTYSSGTYYNAAGERQDGWFATDILNVGDRVVYWLVENYAGIGAVIKPENKITLIKSAETGYKNASTYAEETEDEGGAVPTHTCDSVMDYYKNRTTSTEVENDPATGPGSDQFATVRIAKWTAGYDETGAEIPKEEYTPLGNAKFDLYVVDRDGNRIALLDTLTTGLDNDLSDTEEDNTDLTAWASSRAYMFRNMWDLYSGFNENGDSGDVIWFGDTGDPETVPNGTENGYMRVALVETSAPAGYVITNNVYYMILCFEAVEDGSSSSETYNDAYYMTDDPGTAETASGTAEGEEISWLIYANHEDGTPVEGIDNNTEKQMLVNWPVNNYAVTVNKYGYEPNDSTLNKAAEGEGGLDEFFITGSAGGERTPLAGVTMRLQRNNGTAAAPSWVDYDYKDMHAAAAPADAQFTTDKNGSFSFPNGLIRGQYRIIEVQAADGYENIYNSESRARYFTVTDDNVTVNMYNPEKLSMTIKKTDMEGNPIDSFGFTLTNTADSTTIQADTGTDGKGTAVLSGIASGTYRLTESGTGYTSAYLAQYIEETYPGLTDMVGTAGIRLGYTTEVSADGKDVVITDIKNLDDYGVRGDLTLTIQNPKNGSLTVRKVNEEDPAEMLDAEFKIERQYFDILEGTYTVDNDWTTVYENYATGDDGVFTLDDLSPGVYRITETKAPEGFEMIEGGTSRIIAITGGMDITVVTADGSVPTYKDNAELTFENRKLAGITVNKLLDGLAPGSDEEYSFEFTLYDSRDAGSDDIVGTDTALTKGDTQTSAAQFTGLSKGETYYLEETGENTKDFALAGAALQDDSTGATITETTDTSGNRVLYAVTIPESIPDDTNVAVDVTNKYLYAEVTIFKADADDGTGLDGAEFEVYRVTAAGEEKLETTVQAGEKNPELEWITPEGRQAGEYTARIRLSGTGEETFRIRETAAPQDHIPAGDNVYIEVTLQPGEQKTYGTFSTGKSDEELLADLIMPNEKGAYIELSKYDNVYGSSNAELLNGAEFTIYTKADENAEWSRLESAVTGADGEDGAIRFVVNGGSLYAIAETGLPEGGRYEGLESIHRVTAEGAEKWEVTDTDKLDDNTTLYILNREAALEPGETYYYNAYNTPYTELEIRKEDAGEASSVPKAVVSVYELTDDQAVALPDDRKLTESQIEELMQSARPLVEDVTTGKEGDGYSYADSSVAEELGQAVAGRTYLAVETSVAETEGYNSTLIKDDNRVVWYAVKTIPEGGATGDNAVVLRNISGSVTQSLSKTADTAGIQESLFDQGAVLDYTLTPAVNSNTYALAGYTLTDSGLTAYSKTGEKLEGYLTDGYSITTVTVGQTSHDVSMYDISAENTAAAGVIYAEVTFYDFEGDVVSQESVIVSDGEKTVVLPAGEEKAASVSVRYYSEGFQAETEGRYSLGQKFTPGKVTISAEIDRQEGGAGRQEIMRITNDASASVSYRSWSSTGVQDEEPHTETVHASAHNQFGTQDTAVVSVEKEADKTSVNVGDTLTYTITITNHANAGDDLVDPIVIDFLPQGVELAGTDEDVKLTDAGGPDSDLTMDPGHAYRTESRGDDTAVLIFLVGTLAPGESAEVTVYAEAGASVVSHGTTLRNNVYVTSDQAGVESADNPGRASFKNTEGEWAETLDTVAADLGSRLGTLKDLLGNIGGYGFVGNSNEITWNSGSTLTLVKSASADPEEDGFSTGQVTTVNNGTVTYRLTLSNSNSREGSTNFSVVDILPADGDYVGSGTVRNSQWPLHFGEIGSVRVVSADGSESVIDSSHYTVWYYNGEINGQGEYAAVYAAAQAEEIPSGWSEERGEDTKAFMLRTDNTVSLGENQSLIIEYTAKVGEYDDIEKVAYLNAMNSFSSQYDYYYLENEKPEDAHSSQYMAHSNSVPVIVTPDPVKVGGTIWIDKNGNGKWETGEDVKDLSNHTIIQNMMDGVEIRLLEYTGTSQSSTSSQTYNKDGNAGWDEDPNFVFENLAPARLLDTVTDIYGTDAYPGGILDPSKLKGEQPYTYQIAVTLPGTIEGRFNITSVGATSGFSRNPASDYLADGADERTDNNYSTSAASSGIVGVSERFYLWPTSADTVWDNSKDIGLVPVRDLELTKTAEDDPDTPVPGAEFTIYGPYEDGESADISSAESEGKVAGTYTTDAEGKINVEDLLWFYDYVIVETTPAAGYELDGAAASGTNITARADGKGWVLHTPDEESTDTTEEVAVTNKREAKIEISASKELTGRDLKAGEFTFELLDSDGTTVLAEAKNNADGAVTFEITAEGAGTHTYYIREKSGAEDNGVEYDDTNYRVTVRTEWDSKENRLVQGETVYYIDDVAQQDGAVFENSYTAEGSWTPEGIKTLTGRKMTEEDEFTFSVKDEDGTEVLTGTAAGTADAEQAAIVFDGSISYELADLEGEGQKTFTYTIEESGVGDNGLTFDTKPVTVTVTVTDDGEGNLIPSAVYTKDGKTIEQAEFENTYAAEETEYTPSVEKVFTGIIPEDKTLTFELAADGDNPEGAVLPGEGEKAEAEVTYEEGAHSAEEKAAAFGAIRFTEEGTYRFVITERSGTEGDGYTYDDTEWTLTVVVTDNGKGKLEIADTDVVYTPSVPDAEHEENNTDAVFLNSYQPAAVSQPLKVSKTVSGEDIPDGTKAAFNFSFSLSAGDGSGVAMPEDTTAETEITQNGESGRKEAVFDEITFTKAGRYTFAITETVPEDPEDRLPGYSYDGRTWYADITVDDEGGSLTVTDVTYRTDKDADGSEDEITNETEAQFENRYSTTSIGYTPKVLKNLTGDPIPEDKEFTFELTADAKNPQGGASLEGADKDTAAVTALGTAGERDQALSGSFGEITFTKSGTYYFHISERAGESGKGYAYDGSQWTLTVVIRDTGGALAVQSVTYSLDNETPDGENNVHAIFDNSYELTETEYTPSVRKELTGDETPADDQKTFRFTLEAAEDNPNGAELDDVSASVTGDGTTAEEGADPFGRITFTREGEFSFIIREEGKPADAGGYTYDAGYWTLTVTVEDQDGRLTVTDHTYSYTPADGGEDRDDSDTEAGFINSYAVAETTFVPQIRKTLAGDETPADDQKRFTFELTADEDNPEGAVLGDADDRSAAVTGAGTTADPGADSFGAITFTRADTYRFAIRETGTAPDGYTFDDGVWTLTVTVEDENGALQVTGHTYTYTPGTGADRADSTAEAEFVNTYEVTAAAYTPQAAKELTGAKTPADQQKTFRFTVEAAADNPEGAVLGDADDRSAAVTGAGTTADPGADSFGAVTFTKAGVFDLIIRETDDEEPGYDYDDGYWTLTVTVEDKDSILTVTGTEYVYTGEGTAHEANDAQALFINDYQVTPTDYTPLVEKVIDGEYPADQARDFTFKLEAEEGNPENGAQIPSGSLTIKGEGGKGFDRPIRFTKAGTYNFLISEEKGSAPGYEYDDTQWRLTVVITDVNSQLTVASARYEEVKGIAGRLIDSLFGADEEAEAVFTNTYTVVPTEEVLHVTKTVTGDVPEGRDQTFTFRLSQKDGNPDGAVLPQDDEVTVTGSGSADFGEITFSRADTYRFEIREINDGVPGYSYDGSVWTVTVAVRDQAHELVVESVTYEKEPAGSGAEDGAAGDGSAEDAAAAGFTNSYSTTEVSYMPLVEKTITGDDRPVEKRFEFELAASEDNPDGAVLAGGPVEDGEGSGSAEDAGGPVYAAVEGEGRTSFAPIRFVKAGEYDFSIRELDDKANGYTYDESIWNLHIVVEDVDSILTITELSYTKEDGTQSGEAAVFTNAYDSGSVSWAPRLVKKVEGEVPDGTDQTFEFVMEAADDYDGCMTMPQDKTVTLDGAGEAAFDEITFRKAGTYSFRIHETAGDVEGFTYDPSVWTVTADVADEDGQLVVKGAVYRKDGTAEQNAQAAWFLNKYDEAAAADTRAAQTGDDTNAAVPFLMMCGSVFTVCAVLFRGRRKKNGKE